MPGRFAWIACLGLTLAGSVLLVGESGIPHQAHLHSNIGFEDSATEFAASVEGIDEWLNESQNDFIVGHQLPESLVAFQHAGVDTTDLARSMDCGQFDCGQFDCGQSASKPARDQLPHPDSGLIKLVTFTSSDGTTNFRDGSNEA